MTLAHDAGLRTPLLRPCGGRRRHLISAHDNRTGKPGPRNVAPARGKMDRVIDVIADLKRRVTALEEGQAALAQGLAGVNRRLDRLEARFDRIEHRLDLAGWPA